MTPKSAASNDIPTLSLGQIVASLGRQVVVEIESGVRLPCRLHGRKLSVVCGDQVEWAYAPADPSQGLVYGVRPRRTLLSRLVANGMTEPVVANLSCLVAVVAPRPTPDWFIVDRYLAGAAWSGLDAVLACNKSDLVAAAPRSTDRDELTHELAMYERLGYRIVHTCAHTENGTDGLVGMLAHATSVLVGQSGTGKSSLLNALVPEAHAVTQEISRATEEGKHTTTTSVLHRLKGGGALIDSPGVRDYAPPLPLLREVASGFREIDTTARGCKFQDCLHLSEPGCAVQVALAQGLIHPRRYDSFRRLLTLTREFAARAANRPNSRR